MKIVVHGYGLELGVAQRDEREDRNHRRTTQPEVRDFEPEAALFAGRDGLDAIRRLVRDAPTRLTPNGWLVFEFGFGQADAVGELISSTAGLRMVALRRDLQAIPRAAVAQRV